MRQHSMAAPITSGSCSVRGKAKIVALFVDPVEDLLAEVMAGLDPDLIQLHGKETPQRVAEIGKRWGRPVIKAVSIATRADADSALQFAGTADLLLFDAKAPPELKTALPGGNGISFDWRMLDGIKGKVPFMLSGGLNPDNVAEAIRLSGALMVDVSSGVEVKPGEKDPALVRRFLSAAKQQTAVAETTGSA